MTEVKVVIGANYGDEGKGLASAYFLAEGNPCRYKLTVLTNGGAQRGHTVENCVETGRWTKHTWRHVFHHVGSSLFGATTYIPKGFCVNPLVFLPEWRELYNTGDYCADFRVIVHPEAMVTTPWDMLANQYLETDRAGDRHGSTGMGIWATMVRHQHCPLYYRDLCELKEHELIAKLLDVRKAAVDYYFGVEGGASLGGRRNKLWDNLNLLNHFASDCKKMSKIAKCKILGPKDCAKYGTVVFENAQGLLLSEAEENPFTTPSCTGIESVNKVAEEMGLLDSYAEICYVTRSYVTRHGAGPLTDECPRELLNKEMHDATNEPNQWQGALRYGLLDIGKLNERVGADFLKNRFKGARKSVMLTHANEFELDDRDLSTISGLRYVSSTPYVKDVKCTGEYDEEFDA